MRFGTAYYPELTPEAEWSRDLDLMRQHGIEAVRVFEFAWAALEPREGEMDWAWADRFLDLLEERHMGAVLCRHGGALGRAPLSVGMAIG
jgi:beta-galactosidase